MQRLALEYVTGCPHHGSLDRTLAALKTTKTNLESTPKLQATGICWIVQGRGEVIRILWAALASWLLAMTTVATVDDTASGLPPRLESYLAKSVTLTLDERKQLANGAPVTKLLDVEETEEIAVFGAIWIDAPIRRYVEAVDDIERFESGNGFRVTKRISAPPRIEDFAELHLPDEDAIDLQTCRVGDCSVKLSERSLERFRTEIDWKKPSSRAAADRLMQRLAFEYVTGYLEGGNDRLAVYRDHARPTFVAQEFREMIDQMPELTTFMPSMRRYLLGYPKETLAGAKSFLYWQETNFGLKPTIRISHLTIRENPEDTIVTSKMLYASHYFWTGLELRALLPDPSRGPGFWFVTVNRSRSDGLSGFRGMFVRPRVRSEVVDGALGGLKLTKRKLEGR